MTGHSTEATDLFFADAIILVEGLSEETYIKYLIDNEKSLRNYHIKVYRIDGAYAHKFISLLNLIKIKTIILTDLDLRRKKRKDENEKKIVSEVNIKNLEECRDFEKECLTTNAALKKFIIEIAKYNNDNPDNQDINKKIIEIIGDREYLKITLPTTNISIYSQGKINGSYATSFEEAIILTNGETNRESLKSLLQEIHPQNYSSNEFEDEDFLENSFKYQYEIAIGHGKEKFSTGLIYNSINEDNFKIEKPKYISVALQELSQSFEE